MTRDLALRLYLSATTAIISKCQTLRAEARRNPDYDPETVAIIVRLADRQQAKELREARRAYECTLEAVAEAMHEPFPVSSHLGG